MALDALLNDVLRAFRSHYHLEMQESTGDQILEWVTYVWSNCLEGFGYAEVEFCNEVIGFYWTPVLSGSSACSVDPFRSYDLRTETHS